MQLGEAQRAVGVRDVAEDAAGADRGELLIIADQPDACTAFDGELDGGVEREGVGHAGFVDDRPVSVPQTHFLPDRDVAEAMIAGSAVEVGDELAGRSEHDRVESGRSILKPKRRTHPR